MASSESWTRGSSAELTSSSGTFTWPTKETVKHTHTDKQTGRASTWIKRFGSSYIVNIMHTALLLIVLFERAVTVEFPDDTQKKVVLFYLGRISDFRHYKTEQWRRYTQYLQVKGNRGAALTVPALTSWCCRQSAWGTWLCRADLDQHLSFSLSFLQTDCACNVQKSKHAITHTSYNFGKILPLTVVIARPTLTFG